MIYPRRHTTKHGALPTHGGHELLQHAVGHDVEGEELLELLGPQVAHVRVLGSLGLGGHVNE